MKMVKRILVLMLSAVLMLTALSAVSFADTGDALSFDTAMEIEEGKTVKGEMSEYGTRYYKISCESAGTLTVKLTSKIRATYWYLFDEDGAEVAFEKVNVKTGNNNSMSEKGDTTIRLVENSVSQKSVAELTYKVKKGNYYVAVKNDNPFGGKDFSFTANFKADKETEFSYLGITLKKGASMQLEAVDADAKDIKWTSSKKSVATVSSKGVIKAKKKGTAIITCKSGDVTVKLKVTVK